MSHISTRFLSLKVRVNESFRLLSIHFIPCYHIINDHEHSIKLICSNYLFHLHMNSYHRYRLLRLSEGYAQVQGDKARMHVPLYDMRNW